MFLPVPLDLYAAHYRQRAEESVITSQQAETLVSQLEDLQRANPDAIIGNPNNKVVDTTTYYERNTAVVSAADALIAFQVNDSEGVGDTVKKAAAQGKPVHIERFTIG